MLYTKDSSGTDGRRTHGQSTRLGFDSQVFNKFNIIFLFMFICSANVQDAPYAHHLKRTRVPPIQIKGVDARSRLCPGQCANTQAKKVKQIASLIGPGFSSPYLTNWDYPPWFAFSFHFFLYLIFNCNFI